MASANILDKAREEETVGQGLAPAVMGEITDILEQGEPGRPAKDPDRAYLFYSVPLAGVRYYGYEGRPAKP